MTLFYYDDRFLEHDTGGHPENAQRLRSVMARLREAKVIERCTLPSWDVATDDELERVHSQDNIEAIRSFVAGGGGQIEADTVVSDRSMVAAELASGAVCDAVERVTGGQDQQAFCLVRPPGHHAMQKHPMGFCLFNNVAVAAMHAIDQCGLQRVLVIDWDVHHGNGTQASFWRDDRVGFLSMHRYPFYPGSGGEDETGEGAGLGYTVNLPVTYGTSPKAQLSRFRKGVEALAERVKPELVLVSAGFDSHALDPIGSLQLESEDFQTLTQIVQSIADVHCEGRLVSMLEGGYNPDALAESVQIHLETLLDR